MLDASASLPEPGRAIARVTWDAGDGTLLEGATVSHVYAAPGTYRATVTVTDEAGAAATATVDVVARAVSLALRPARLTAGQRVVAGGAVAPAAGGVEVRLEQRRGTAWRPIGTTQTAADGSFALRVALDRGGPLRAVALAPDATSGPAAVQVRPRLALRAGRATAFVGGTVVARVRPAGLDGPATLTVLRAGRPLATMRVRVRGGVVRAEVPAPAVGALSVRLDVPARAGFAAARASVPMRSTARPLGFGSRGRDVVGLLRRLGELGVHTPAPTATYGPAVGDAVLAFQKAVGLPRTSSVGPETWRRLGLATPIRPRFRGPANRIEVDKTRQILIKVRANRVIAVLPVSTGRSGNTPEGRWRVRWKAPATTTWLGPAILYRTLTFWGNSFAIHGYPSVPAHPASSGCVRIPIWTADWLYERTPVGEAVYVYR